MSSIGVNVVGTGMGSTIDVDKMTQRLTAMRSRLSSDYVSGGKTNQQLANRISAIDKQIDRLHQFSGQNVNISQDRATQMLQNGMQQLHDGMDYLASQGEADTASTNRVGNWYNSLSNMLGHVDVQA